MPRLNGRPDYLQQPPQLPQLLPQLLHASHDLQQLPQSHFEHRSQRLQTSVQHVLQSQHALQGLPLLPGEPQPLHGFAPPPGGVVPVPPGFSLGFVGSSPPGLLFGPGALPGEPPG